MLHFCDWETKHRYILLEEFRISETELSSLVDKLRDFLKAFDQASKCMQITIPEPSVVIGSTKVENNLFTEYYNDIFEHLNTEIEIIVYRSHWGTKNIAFFSSEKPKNAVINSNLKKLSTLIIANFNTSTRTHITVQSNVKLLRAKTMCSTFTPDCRYDESITKVTGNVYCPNTKDFSSLEWSDYQCPLCELKCQLRQIPLKNKQFRFSWFVTENLSFWGDAKINSRCYWRYIKSSMSKRKVCFSVSQQKFSFLHCDCKKYKAFSNVPDIPFT